MIHGDIIDIDAYVKTYNTIWKAQPISLNIVYEDRYLLVINKNSNCVVHPGNNNLENTVFNALLYKYSFLRDVPRAGIIHRLDKDTTGLMIIAKNLMTYYLLKQLLKNHRIIRIYEAIVYNNIHTNQIINFPIKKKYINKKIKMFVHPQGIQAITKIFVQQCLPNFTYLKVQLYTGRTHQIRVHLSYIKHSIIGDPLYKQHHKKNTFIQSILQRQALHASYLEFYHPIYNFKINIKSDLPQDIKNILHILQKT
ncbi:RluA family pseudouridine synthase [Enterobacteriaceae endosymbiont of Macroplea appendiculata]|nr:RluA family pseudouridine synthase [Enterobacteriaceae endosymbiont of Macroplea appendiculata]